MTDPQDSQPRLLKAKIWYAPMAEKQLGWLEEEKKQVVLAKLKRLPKTAGAVARPVPEQPDYLTVEIPDPPPPPLLIVYRYTARFKLLRRAWEIAGLVFPSAVDFPDDQPHDVMALLNR